MITAGADVGSKTVKILILKDGTIAGKGMATGGLEVEGAWNDAWDAALKEAGVSRDDIEKTIGTGARLKEIKGYDDEMSMVTADARAMHEINPEIRTILDVGAEEGRAIKVDANGKVPDFAVNEKCAAGDANGKVPDFAVNEKCAAGAGAFSRVCGIRGCVSGP
ncbi:MAG: hypothetical protein JRI74_03670 [Deltaproteobacteria bacterium]|nr:hypothetical protein [Deltaproteobacteria bacterium]